uniref:Odorant receptor n=1 Tax=Yemma signatus TaxID=300820 RepID=A0A385H530_9HEMI|nr:odorant receptor [Yemma signatus]
MGKVSKEDLAFPVDLLEIAVEFSGMAPRVPGVKPWYYMPLVLLAHVIYVNGYLCTSLYLLSERPFFDKMESLQCFLSLFHMFAKYCNVHYNTSPYRRLLATARHIWEEGVRLRPQYHKLTADIANEAKLSMKLILLLFAGAVPTSSVMTFIYNMQVESKDRETLYMVWDPVPDESWYWTSCLYEGSVMALSLMLLATSLAACYWHCLMAAGQMRVLQTMLEEDKVDIKACAILHQNILGYVKQIQDYFSGQMFLEVVLASLQNSMRAYMCMKMFSNGDPKAIGASFILVLCMIGPFIVCLSGHVVTDNSEKVFIAAYQGKWYASDVRDQRGLAIISTMATKIIRLHYRGLLDFNMERYSMVQQATYSYVTLLKGADVDLV